MLGPMIDAWDASVNAWFASLGAPVEGTARLVLAAAFGGLVGLEREVRGRQAGFRTYLLVCLGSALVMLVSLQFASHRWPDPVNYNLNIDPARIAYGVMTGVGFLGAGVIVHNKGSVRGLTTAAGLWCVAAMGLSVGVGMYIVSALATVLIVGALWILDYVESLIPKVRYRRVTIRTTYRPRCIPETVDLFKGFKIKVVDAHFERTEDLRSADVHLQIAMFDSEPYYELERKIDADPDYQLMSTREV
jgi:putative Mg2+ transporter-C (MgtC) family protein